MKLAVIGVGAFGRNHLRVYRELAAAQLPAASPVKLVALVEQDAEKAAELRAGFASENNPPIVFSSLDELLAAQNQGDLSIDAASVCVPTSDHFKTASALLTTGIDLLVEKPIAVTLDEADRMIALAQQHGRVLQIGHLERFNPAITAAEAICKAPMFFEAHRLSVFSPRALDVDVVLDLMVHDLDVVLHLAQSAVTSVHAVGLPIVSPKVDIANVRVEFASGCVANFTASRISTERVRKLRFFQPHQYVSIDYARKDLLVIDAHPDMLGDLLKQSSEGATKAQSALPPGLTLTPPQIFAGEPLRLEIEAFLEAVQSRAVPRVSGQDGRAALALALQINASIAAHAARTGLGRP